MKIYGLQEVNDFTAETLKVAEKLVSNGQELELGLLSVDKQ